LRVVYETLEVGLEIARAVEWWRANRDKAPDALEEDLAEAHQQLSEQGELIGVLGRRALACLEILARRLASAESGHVIEASELLAQIRSEIRHRRTQIPDPDLTS